MALFEYQLDDHVALVTMNHGENRFTYDSLDAFEGLLEEIEQKTRATVLLVKSAHEKIWSNGIDLEWLLAEMGRNPEAGTRFPERLMQFLRRLLTYPLITVAAINGHAFAGGAIMACAFDFRFMRTDRGYFCFPEVDIQIPFMPGMDAILKKALPNPAGPGGAIDRQTLHGRGAGGPAGRPQGLSGKRSAERGPGLCQVPE